MENLYWLLAVHPTWTIGRFGGGFPSR